jgi:predicted amidohydrolase YtcJ
MNASHRVDVAHPDTALVGGKIVTVDPNATVAEALAIGHGRISAVGSSAEIRRLAGPLTSIVELGGRTVIPGLIDSHLHAIRDGRTFGVRPDWSAVSTLKQALDTVRAAGRETSTGTWIIVIGGWDPYQFAEKRSPTPRELDEAAPDHPVYVQQLYDLAVLNRRAMQALRITAQTALPPAGQVEVDASGDPTGIIRADGSVATLAGLERRLPEPSFEQQVDSTRAYFRELNRVGITGILDGGGSDFVPAQYHPLFALWRRGGLTLRVRYDLTSPNPGTELSDIKTFTQLLPPRFGNDWLRFNGPGEIVIWGMHDGSATAKTFTPSSEAKAALSEFAHWAARNGYPLHIHASQNSSAEQILDVFEQVNQASPIAPLRWAIVHIEDASDETLRRMKALGVGYAVQDRLYFAGDDYAKLRSAETLRRAPPIVTAMKMGIEVSGGTDALAISSFNPFVSLRWFLDGKTITGAATRGPDELPSRLDALRIYTLNSAWMTFDENERGSLEVGKVADLAVLDRDYMTIPIDDIPKIESLLTIVGGKIVHAAKAGPFPKDNYPGQPVGF